jgi:hypothetical protein
MFFKTLAKLVSSFTRQVRKQLALSTEIVSEGKKPHQAGVGLYFYLPSQNSTRIWQVGEWLSTPLSYTSLSFHIFRSRLAASYQQ